MKRKKFLKRISLISAVAVAAPVLASEILTKTPSKRAVDKTFIGDYPSVEVPRHEAWVTIRKDGTLIAHSLFDNGEIICKRSSKIGKIDELYKICGDMTPTTFF